MKKNWRNFLDDVIEKINTLSGGIEILFFRGHSNCTWELLPSLFRQEILKQKKINAVETAFYYDFVSNAGSLLGNLNKKSWEFLFLMQHYAIPTRLLDWSENFVTALYFALENEPINEPEIWILKPYKLNSKTKWIGNAIYNPDLDFGSNYYETFIDGKTSVEIINPIAIYPLRVNQRIFNQKGFFTLHGKLKEPLNELFPDCVERIKIPMNAISDAKQFLKLSGVNRFSIYNDLESLSKLLKENII